MGITIQCEYKKFHKLGKITDVCHFFQKEQKGRNIQTTLVVNSHVRKRKKVSHGWLRIIIIIIIISFHSIVVSALCEETRHQFGYQGPIQKHCHVQHLQLLLSQNEELSLYSRGQGKVAVSNRFFMFLLKLKLQPTLPEPPVHRYFKLTCFSQAY